MAYYEAEPWGSSLEGVRMAHNTAAVFNAGLMNASPKQYNSKRAKPKDFFIGVHDPSKQVRRLSPQVLKQKFLSCFPSSMVKKVKNK